MPLAVPPATPMKNGIARPKLALALLLGEAGVSIDAAEIKVPFDAAGFICSPIPFLKSAAADLLTIKQLGVLAKRHYQAA